MKIENSIVPWLGKTMKMVDNSIEDLLLTNGIDLTKNQFVILKNIEEHEGLSQNELAFFSNRNKSTLARMVATLERKKYIIKRICKDDKRKSKLLLSALGKRTLDQASPYLSQFVENMEKHIDPEDRQIILKVLNQIQDNLIGDGPLPFFKHSK